jgi:hypothetical protein
VVACASARRSLPKKFREQFGHTPVSTEEKIPWQCRRLIIGTGTGALPVMNDVKREAKRRKIALLVLPTHAIKVLKKHPHETNAILRADRRSRSAQSIAVAYALVYADRYSACVADGRSTDPAQEFKQSHHPA